MSPVRMITITSVCQIPLLCCICACIPGTDEAPHKSTPVSPVPNRSCPPLPITLLSDLRKDSPCQSAAHHVFHTLRHCNMLTTYPGLLMLSSCSFLLLHWDSITKTSSKNWKPPIFHTVELTNSTTMWNPCDTGCQLAGDFLQFSPMSFFLKAFSGTTVLFHRVIPLCLSHGCIITSISPKTCWFPRISWQLSP